MMSDDDQPSVELRRTEAGDAQWTSVPTVGSVMLPPDPRLLNAIGLNHAFESAIADLVDNSIDAAASTVLIRFMRNGDNLLGLYVVDDGNGMDSAAIDRAMTLGGRQDYSDSSLGHFGIGLKAASLGQANTFTIVSRHSENAVGRRWTVKGTASQFECEVVDPDYAAEVMDTEWDILKTTTGTVVRWDDVKAFPRARSHVVNRYLEQAFLNLRQHLGLVFHRLIEAGRVAIVIDQHDVSNDSVGPPFHVEHLDPFAYPRTGRPDYPKQLDVHVNGRTLTLNCHVWPGRSQRTNFRLPSRPPEDYQGLYFYRHDRLLQAGGWNGTATPEREHQLARVVIDIDDELSATFAMNAEKSRVEASPDFHAALDHAHFSDGRTWDDYMADAADAFRQSRKRTRTRARVVPPGKGFAPVIRKAIERELDFIPGEDPIAIRWKAFDGEAFFEIDRDEPAIWLNKRYRWAVLGDKSSSLNDAPLVKALLYLLVENLFQGSYLGAKDRDNIDLYSEILVAAAQAELT